MARRSLQVLLTLLGLLVLVRFGFTGAVWGPIWLPDVSAVSRTLDSEYRFLAVCAAGLGVLFIWVGRAPERHGQLLHILAATTLVGGLVRAATSVLGGWPEPPAVAAMGIELVAPLLVWALYFQLNRH